MAKSPAFQFYPDSWLSSQSITLMTAAEEGAYIRLLSHAWLSPDCGLPSDSESLKVLSRLGATWTKSEAKIRAKFRQNGERLFNDRLLEERTKQALHREKSSEGGKRSGETRRQPNMNHPSILAGGLVEPKTNSSFPSSSPSPFPVKTQTARHETSDDDSSFFMGIWAKWKRQRRDQPMQIVVQLVSGRDGFDWATFRANAPKYIAWCEGMKPEPWKFASLTLWEWIEGGMILPPEAKTKDLYEEIYGD